MIEDSLNSLELKKRDKISKEIKRLKKIFKNIDKNKMNVVNKLIESAAFMSVQLTELEEDMTVNGVTEEYQNGKDQRGVKASVASTVYNTMIKNYSSVIKQLTELSPPSTSSGTGNAVMDFALRNGTKRK